MTRLINRLLSWNCCAFTADSHAIVLHGKDKWHCSVLCHSISLFSRGSTANCSVLLQSRNQWYLGGQFVCLLDSTAVSSRIPQAVLIVYTGPLCCHRPTGQWSHGNSVVALQEEELHGGMLKCCLKLGLISENNPRSRAWVGPSPRWLASCVVCVFIGPDGLTWPLTLWLSACCLVRQPCFQSSTSVLHLTKCYCALDKSSDAAPPHPQKITCFQRRCRGFCIIFELQQVLLFFFSCFTQHTTNVNAFLKKLCALTRETLSCRLTETEMSVHHQYRVQ